MTSIHIVDYDEILRRIGDRLHPYAAALEALRQADQMTDSQRAALCYALERALQEPRRP